MTAVSLSGPARGADRAVLLAPGAGSDREAPILVAVAEALAAAGVPALRFDFPYRRAGRKAPDRPQVLAAAVEEAVAELGRYARLPRERLVVGGRSMGGRYCSMAAADGGALGCVLLGYPLHPPGRPDRLRTDHFGGLTGPVLFVQGTRDPFGTPEEVRAAAALVPGPVTFHWVESGDHGFRPLRASGRTLADETAAVAAAVTEFVVSC